MNDVFSSKLSPGTAGCPPAAHPALCQHPPDSCWWRPAPPADLCTPGGRGQTRVCSHCAPFRLRCEEIHWVAKQWERGVEGKKMSAIEKTFSAGRYQVSYFLFLSVSSQVKLLPTCRSRRHPARHRKSCSRRSHVSSWVSRTSSRCLSLCRREPHYAKVRSLPPEAWGAKNSDSVLLERWNRTVWFHSKTDLWLHAEDKWFSWPIWLQVIVR